MATERTLTDNQGRRIDVKLIAKTDKSVVVIRSDGAQFEIGYDLLSQADREFLSQWQPPEPEAPSNPVEAVVIMRSKSGMKGFGSGFFAHDKGRTYIYTNQHVISDIMNVQAVDYRGNLVELGKLEVSNSKDLARFSVNARPALKISDNVKLGESIVALGNSEGAGVITNESGRVQGIGPSEIEVSTKFVPGNSGGPVINDASEVIGVASYIKSATKKPDWVKQDSRYTQNRRFTIRPSRVEDWRELTREEYYNQVSKLGDALTKLDQAYWTYSMLVEGKGYLSSLPEDWERDILQILRNHNARQRKPDSTTTSNTVSDITGTYIVTNTVSHAEKKAISRRTNLRALDSYLKMEFGNLFMLENTVDVEYLVNNDFASIKTLKAWVNQIRTEIGKEITHSKNRF